MDHISKEHRSWNMSQIKSKNTKPELMVRSALHLMGYRFRLNGKISKQIFKKGVIPGKPDIVMSKYKLVIFVNGCFWHQHENCKRATIPKSNTEYWIKKLSNNVTKDKINTKKIKKNGFKVIVIWECEINNPNFIEILHDKISKIIMI